MYFYSVCALVIWAAGGRRIFPYALAVIAAVAAVTLVIPEVPAQFASVLKAPVLIEFMIGVAIAEFATDFHLARGAHNIGTALLVLGCLLFALSAFSSDPLSNRLFYWGIPGGMMVLGAALLRTPAATPIAKSLLFLGDASYSIYLAHPLATLTLGNLLKRGAFKSVNPDVLLIATWIGTCLGTAILYLLVEKRINIFFKARQRRAAR